MQYGGEKLWKLKEGVVGLKPVTNSILLYWFQTTLQSFIKIENFGRRMVEVVTDIQRPDRQWRSTSFQESKKVRVSRDLLPWPWAQPGCRLTRRPSCTSLVAIRPFAWEKKRFSCQHKSARITWPLTLSTTWMHADLESILWKFGGDLAICLREAICAKVYRQMDGRTDDGRRTIALAHSWNELKKRRKWSDPCCRNGIDKQHGTDNY